MKILAQRVTPTRGQKRQIWLCMVVLIFSHCLSCNAKKKHAEKKQAVVGVDGMRLVREGRLEEAAEAFLRSGRISGSAADYYNAALAYSQLGNTAMASEALQHAVAR